MLNTPPPKLAFSVAETCATLGLGKTSVYQLIAEGRLDTVKIGGRRIVPAAAIQALLNVKGLRAERTNTYEDQ